MSDTLWTPGGNASTFMCGVEWGRKRLHAAVSSTLTGAAPFGREYVCDPREVEEVTALYDDVHHDVAVWSQLWLKVLADGCSLSAPIF